MIAKIGKDVVSDSTTMAVDDHQPRAVGRISGFSRDLFFRQIKIKIGIFGWPKFAHRDPLILWALKRP